MIVAHGATAHCLFQARMPTGLQRRPSRAVRLQLIAQQCLRHIQALPARTPIVTILQEVAALLLEPMQAQTLCLPGRMRRILVMAVTRPIKLRLTVTDATCHLMGHVQFLQQTTQLIL